MVRQHTHMHIQTHSLSQIDVAVGQRAEPSPLTGCLNSTILIESTVLFYMPQKQGVASSHTSKYFPHCKRRNQNNIYMVRAPHSSD